MNAQQLRRIQENIKFDNLSMAQCLGLTEHCYNKYLYGENAIPPSVKRAALELEHVEKELDRIRNEKHEPIYKNHPIIGIPIKLQPESLRN